jgi:hypothetical protein
VTRTYAARKLLALGPLQFSEFVAITGWPYRACRGVISHLQATGRIVWDGAWRLA